jgi:hypothetical protein
MFSGSSCSILTLLAMTSSAGNCYDLFVRYILRILLIIDFGATCRIDLDLDKVIDEGGPSQKSVSSKRLLHSFDVIACLK